MFGLSRKNKSDELRRWYEEERAREASSPSTVGKAFEFIERLTKLPIYKFSDYKSYVDAGSGLVWPVFRACHITAGVLVKTQFQIVDSTTGETPRVVDPDLQRLMTQPNPYDSWEELVYVWTHHMKLTGNAFWLKDEMDGLGRPSKVYPLMPQFVEIIPDAKKKIASYRYRVNGRSLIFLPDEVIHFRRPSPSDSILGIGDLEPAKSLVGDFINRDVYNEKFIENGASPSGVLVREDAVEDEEAWQKFKAWWDRMYSGKRNVGKTAFLNGKWTYQQLGLSAQQMQSIEREKMSVQAIFTAMGVPLSIAGIEKASNYATARQDDVNFRKYECVPLIDILIGKLNGVNGIVRPFGDKLRMDYSLTGLVDVEQVMKDYKPLFDIGGMTINELRVMAGLPVTDNVLHNQYYVTTNAMPLEMAGLANPTEEEIEKTVFGLTKGSGG